MNEIERFFTRQRENWTNLRRLGVRHAICIECDCNETNPDVSLGS